MNKNERNIGYVLLALAALAFCLPAIHQDQAYHHFADQRTWLGIPHFADVLTNMVIGASGLLGLGLIRTRRLTLPWETTTCLAVFFLGLILTWPGSAYYHWSPSDTTLLWDRLPMTIAFAGVVGAVVSTRVSGRMGTYSLVGLLYAGVGSLLAWRWTGNLAYYAVLQFGGLALVAGVLLTVRNNTDTLPWWELMGWYALAKLLEAGDGWVWHATEGLFAGHAWKHVAAGMAGYAMYRGLRRVSYTEAGPPANNAKE